MSEKGLKQLVGALVLAVVAWLAVGLLTRGGGGIPAAGPIAETFDGVGESNVREIRMRTPSGSVSLVPSGDGWRANGYDADSASVARFFDELRVSEVGDLVATNPANHARMGVTADSAATLEIELRDGEVRTLLFGHAGSRFSTAYVRVPDEDDVYLFQGNLRPQVFRSEAEWRRKRMVSIDTAVVRRLEIERAGASGAVVRADTVWTLARGGAADPGVVRDILSELAGMLASGFVEPGDSLAARDVDGRLRALDGDGRVLAVVTVGAGEQDHWARVEGDSVVYRIPDFRAERVVPPPARLVAPTP